MYTMKSTMALLVISGSLLMAGGDIAPVEPVVPEVVQSDSWNYYASVYVFAAGMGGETAQGHDFDISFSDILDDLDMTYMGNFGAHKGNWTLNADVMYMKIGNKPDIHFPSFDTTLTNVQMKSWIITPTVAYRVMDTKSLKLDVLAGVRYLYMKPKLVFDNSTELSGSGSVWDGIVGLKAHYNVNEQWFVPVGLDIGTGDTDLTWQAFVGVGYKYENFDVIAGYRYLEWEFDDENTGGNVYSSLDVSGPIVGVKYRF